MNWKYVKFGNKGDVMTNTIVGITIFTSGIDKIIPKNIYCYADDTKVENLENFLFRTKQCDLIVIDEVTGIVFNLSGFIFKIYDIDNEERQEIISSRNFYNNLIIIDIEREEYTFSINK